jgi:uncharacterized membrane protein
MSMQTTGSGTEAKTWALIVWGLYIAAFFTGITIIIGVIVAYVKRGELAGTPFESHMTSAIRTFWISLIGYLISAVLMLVLIGFVTMTLVGIWHLFRVIRGIVKALDDRPIDNPEGWL